MSGAIKDWRYEATAAIRSLRVFIISPFVSIVPIFFLKVVICQNLNLNLNEIRLVLRIEHPDDQCSTD